MREILYRGKRIDGYTWVYGSYVRADYNWHKYGVHRDWIVTSAYANGGWFSVCGRYAVDPDTICQYTGVNDKNGKRIFEYDIVAIDGCVDLLTYIKFVDSGFCALLPGEDYYKHRLSGKSERYEVIGNLYDRPSVYFNSYDETF